MLTGSRFLWVGSGRAACRRVTAESASLAAATLRGPTLNDGDESCHKRFSRRFRLIPSSVGFRFVSSLGRPTLQGVHRVSDSGQAGDWLGRSAQLLQSIRGWSTITTSLASRKNTPEPIREHSWESSAGQRGLLEGPVSFFLSQTLQCIQ